MSVLDAGDPVARLLGQAARRPGAPAVIMRDRTVSYGELARLVGRLAAAIRSVDGDAPRVLVRLPQGPEAYASMFAALMAGGSYAPVNVEAPAEHQDRVAREFAPTVVVAPADRPMPAACTASAPVIDPSRLSRTALETPRPPGALAYTIFTSGSTGVPKGVMIPRSALTHYVAWSISALRPGPGDRCSQHPNIGFDLSVLDIYAALGSGAALVPIVGARDRLLPAEAIRDLGITVWISVPSVVDLMGRAGGMRAEVLGTLRLLFFCGEPLLPGHLEAIFTARPDVTVLNAYGPTEATVSCTALPLCADTWRTHCETTVALGEPIPGMSLRLDGGAGPDEGEIVLGGPQLALGYWRDEARSEAAFPSAADGSGREYRTGDWAERRDGRLFFRRRLDRQVKLRGHRVELGEIDAALRQAGARLAFTCLDRDRLVSFVEGEARCSAERLREAVSLRLPSYAVPRDIRVLPRLPRNGNDKIDTRRLSDLAARPVAAEPGRIATT